jgi:EAL domain-containing protein (putative c-di-GMP-specific phosphodiesterase class I)/GGDEF domain-containing protein
MIFIVSIQLLIAFFIFYSGGTKNSYVYLELSAIIIGGFVLGPFGGAFLGITGGFFLGPFMPADTTTMLMQEKASWLFRLFFYIFTGYISGVVIEYLLNIIDRLSSITLYNPVTKLPNKNYFENMARDYHPDEHIAVIKFEEYPKMIENLGLDYAKDFIHKISDIFVKIFNKKDVNDKQQNVFHLEEDKFAIIFSDSEMKDNFKVVYKTFYKAIKEKNMAYFPSYFIGISPWSGSNTEVLQKAEIARRSARKNLNFYEVYYPELSEHLNKNFDLSLEIPRAINNREFFLTYHPKINLKSGEVEGVEALIRWRHPEKGLIPPDAFIPYIEKTSMINTVTEWVIKTAFSEIKNMEKEDINTNFSVNIPLKILENSKIKKYIEAYKINSLPLYKLELEILERDNVDNFKETASAMKDLKKLGINFSLDDYGTGYSTLSYMQKLPFDIIKIDRMFIKDIETNERMRALVQSTIDIGHTLGMEVVAEGVETIKSVEILQNMGCDFAQGYHYAKPMTYLEFIRWHKDYNSTEKLA